MRVRIPPPALTNMLQPAASFIGRARITISRILCEADAHEWRPRSTGDAPSARLSLGASPLRSRTVGILQRFPERLRPIPSHRDLGARRTRRSCTTPARRSLGFARDDNVPRGLNQYANRCRSESSYRRGEQIFRFATPLKRTLDLVEYRVEGHGPLF